MLSAVELAPGGSAPLRVLGDQGGGGGGGGRVVVGQEGASAGVAGLEAAEAAREAVVVPHQAVVEAVAVT